MSIVSITSLFVVAVVIEEQIITILITIITACSTIAIDTIVVIVHECIII